MKRILQLAVIGLLVLVLYGCLPDLAQLAGSPSPAQPAKTAALTGTRLPDTPARFSVNSRVLGSVDALKDVALVVRTADLTRDHLQLRVAFENTSDRFFLVTGHISGDSIALEDANGKSYSPRSVDEPLSNIEPEGGFAPGGANVGEMEFSRPSGDGPFELHVPNFPPLSFRLDTPLADTPSPKVKDGVYPVTLMLHSGDKALAPVDLSVESVKFQTETVTLKLEFVNTYRQGYRLLNGPSGADARLLDSERRQLRPANVSPSLAHSIAPDKGWDPGGSTEGEITFARPADVSDLRLVFPGYSTGQLRFDSTGLVEARAISPDGGPPAPTATPRPEDMLYTQLDQLLGQQSKALLGGDATGFLSTFTPDLQAAQRVILQRAGKMPFDSYSVVLDPDSELDPGEAVLQDVKALVRYTLQGISSDNSFVHVVRLDFKQQQGRWLVSGIKTEEDPPFWWSGDVVANTSDHFLVFARPTIEGQLRRLTAMTEAGYQSLAQQGLSLEPRYAAFFTSSEKDFAQYTARADILAGLALWRFEFKGENIVVDSRAFYINGDIFAKESSGSTDLQTTITHELVHLALSPFTRPFTPPWLAEGAAVYFSKQYGAADWRRLAKSGHMASLDLESMTWMSELGENGASASQMADEYVYSGAAFAYLVQQYGQSTALELYRSFADVPASQVRDSMPDFLPSSQAGSLFQDMRVQLTEDAAERYFHLSVTDLDKDVQAWLKAQ